MSSLNDRARVGALGLILLASGLAQADPAAAPATGSGEDARAGALEEVTVTARRKVENLQDVPTAVTALGTTDLQNLRIENFGQVGQTVPNLNIQRQFGSASSPQMFLRGVATGSLKFETDAGVALYVDGVYLGRPAGTAFDVADISRIEVLRGPQGTLFGRNSTGGAINIVTAEPTGVLSAAVEGGVGNYNERRGKITLNLPEAGGFSARITYLHDQHDGYVTRSGAGNTYQFTAPFGTLSSAKDFGNDQTDALGIAVHYGDEDHVKVDYRFDYTDKDSSQLATQLLGQYGFFNPSFDLQAGANVTNVGLTRQDSLPLDTSQTRLKVQGHSLSASYEISKELSVRNILSYRQFSESPNFNDIDGNNLVDTGILSPFLGIPGPAFTLGGSKAPFSWIASIQTRAQHQWSDELQLLGTNGALDWIAGLYFFKENGWDNNPVFLFVPFAPGKVYNPGVTNASILGQDDYAAGSNGTVDNKSEAAFLHGTYKFTDQWNLSAGARFTRDDRKEFLYQAATIIDQGYTRSFNKTVWDLSLTYKLEPGVDLYGKVSTGYLTGGVIGGGGFSPETITSYELGLKSDLLENRLRLNVALFHADRKDLQLLTFSPAAGTQVADGGGSKQDGIELEATFAPVDGLRLNATYGYVKDKFDLNIRSLSPKSTASAAVDYDFARFANSSRVVAHVDASWRGDTYGLACPVGATLSLTVGCTNLAAADLKLDAAVVMKAYTLLGAHLSYADIPIGGTAKAEVSLWGRNLTNAHELEFDRDLANGTVMGTFQEPRTYGVDFKARF